jgi:hypothetical protein
MPADEGEKSTSEEATKEVSTTTRQGKSNHGPCASPVLPHDLYALFFSRLLFLSPLLTHPSRVITNSRSRRRSPLPSPFGFLGTQIKTTIHSTAVLPNMPRARTRAPRVRFSPVLRSTALTFTVVLILALLAVAFAGLDSAPKPDHLALGKRQFQANALLSSAMQEVCAPDALVFLLAPTDLFTRPTLELCLSGTNIPP